MSEMAKALEREVTVKHPVLKASGDDQSPLQRLAERLEPGMRQAFLQAIEQIQNQVELGQVAQAYMSGHLNQIEAELRIGDLANHEPHLQQIIQNGFVQGAAHADDLLDGESIHLSLSLVHHAAVAYAADQSAQLVTVTNDDAKAAIRQVVSNAIERGDHPTTAARMLRSIVGLNERQGIAVTNFYNRLMAEGHDLETALAKTERYSVKALRYRAKMIARTEMIRSVNAGTGAYIDQARVHGHLNAEITFKQWICGPEACEICLPMMEVEVPLDDPWIVDGDEIDLADGDSPHPNCACTYGLVFHREGEGEEGDGVEVVPEEMAPPVVEPPARLPSEHPVEPAERESDWEPDHESEVAPSAHRPPPLPEPEAVELPPPPKKPRKPRVPKPKPAPKEPAGPYEEAVHDIASTHIREIGLLGGKDNVNMVYVAKLENGRKGIWKPESGVERSYRKGIKKGELYRREAAASEVANLVNMNDLMPVTAVRKINGEIGSIQEMRPGVSYIEAEKKGWTNRIPNKDKERTFLFDIFIGNTDRHLKNALVSKTGELSLIDHGNSFSRTRAAALRVDIRPTMYEPVDKEIVREYRRQLPAITEKLKELKIAPEALDLMNFRLSAMEQSTSYRDLLSNVVRGSDAW